MDRRSFLLGSAMAVTSYTTGGCARAPEGKPRSPADAVRVAGLSAPIEIVDDRWGVPHIRAASKADAFFGQGYVAARDRLFQIDLAHRRDMGRMAEAYGAAFAEQDGVARLFHFRGDLNAELAAVPAEVLACARGYVAGINAWIDRTEADPSLLPPEYAILNVRPLRWAVEDLALARGLPGGNVDDEVRRARLAAIGRLDLDALVAPLRPGGTLVVPDGLDAAAVSPADLALLAVARRALPFDRIADPDTDRADQSQAGSNAWTVAGSRSATGRPILANDPHLGIGGFGPRHVVHLSAPGLDVIGAGAPGLPGIMQGHTDRYAFGRTNFHIDQDDLFILELSADDPELYRHGGGWRRFVTLTVIVGVKGGEGRPVTLRYAVQGPVVSHDPARRRASAVASVGMLPGGSGGFAMIAINLARDWAALQDAFRLHPSPTNFHYADVDGTIAWQAIGHAPDRPRHNGLMPVPGDGRYDWRGLRPLRDLPGERDPARGWIASANQNNLRAGDPRPVAYSFREPYRYDRIATVLAGQPKHAVADSVALQQDVLSAPAQALVALLPATPSPAAQAAVAMLRGWDGRVAGDSAAAALYETTWAALNRRFLAMVVPEAARGLVRTVATGELLRLIATPDARFGTDPRAAHDRMLDAALAEGWQTATRLMGAPDGWRWDRLHRVRMAHPLSRIPAIAAAFPPIAGEGSGGDGSTVMARWVNPGRGLDVSGGASFAMVCDVGAWDRSVMVNMPGQSNDPRSPYYQDAYRPWAAGQMRPMPFGRAAVEAAAVCRETLAPAGDADPT